MTLEGDSRLFRLYIAPTHGTEPVESAILLESEDEEEAYLRAVAIAAAFQVECACQVEIRETDLYV